MPNLLEQDEHIDIYIANTASEWIRRYADDRPFCLQVCLMGPHPPFYAPARYRDMFEPQEMPPAIMDPPAEPISPQIKKMFARDLRTRRGLAFAGALRHPPFVTPVPSHVCLYR